MKRKGFTYNNSQLGPGVTRDSSVFLEKPYLGFGPDLSATLLARTYSLQKNFESCVFPKLKTEPEIASISGEDIFS